MPARPGHQDASRRVGGRAAGGHRARSLADPPDLVVFTTGLGVRGLARSRRRDPAGRRSRTHAARRGRTARPRSEGHRRARHGRVRRRLDRAARPVRRHHRSPRRRGTCGACGSPCSSTAPAPRTCATPIEAMGADVVRVPVYRWSLPADVDGRRAADPGGRRPPGRCADVHRQAGRRELPRDRRLHGPARRRRSRRCERRCPRRSASGPVCATGVDRGRPARTVRPRCAIGSARWCSRWRSTSPTQGEDVEMAGTSVRVQGRLAADRRRAEAWLTDRERALLTALLDQPGAVLSKPELLRRVWNGTETDEHLVEVTVARLRQRLGPAADGIETVVRRGYRVTAGMTRRFRPAPHSATRSRRVSRPHDRRSADCGGVHDPFTATTSRGNGAGVRSSHDDATTTDGLRPRRRRPRAATRRVTGLWSFTGKYRILHLTWIAFFLTLRRLVQLRTVRQHDRRPARPVRGRGEDDRPVQRRPHDPGPHLHRHGARPMGPAPGLRRDPRCSPSIPNTIFALSSSFTTLVFSRLALSVVGAGFVVGIRMVSEWFPPSEVGTAEGVYGGWGNFGAAAAAFSLPMVAGLRSAATTAGAGRSCSPA